MINILSPQEAYTLRDSGGGMKLERFGNYTLSRPDPIAIWEPTLASALWQGADALFLKEKSVHQNRWKNQFVDESEVRCKIILSGIS